MPQKFKGKYRIQSAQPNGGIMPKMDPILLPSAPKTANIFLALFPMEKWN